jgi:hypothetical protein
MSDQVRKQTIQKCFCELDELFIVRPNLSGQDVIGWKSAEHESSLLFFEANNFGLYAISIRGRFLPLNRPTNYRQVFDQTVLESSNPLIRIRLKLRFWT